MKVGRSDEDKARSGKSGLSVPVAVVLGAASLVITACIALFAKWYKSGRRKATGRY